MKLTAITLNDVRRFTSPVRVTGIGAGLNVMSAPNEEGKSTLFDALQALFFQSYRSRGKEITAEVFERHADAIFQQAENRLHAQKAVMTLLRSGGV